MNVMPYLCNFLKKEAIQVNKLHAVSNRSFRFLLDVIGAIDVCHIAIKAPEAQQDSYLNRKFFHSINLQGICPARKLFTNIFVGFPGSAHDARVCTYILHFKVKQVFAL